VLAYGNCVVLKGPKVIVVCTSYEPEPRSFNPRLDSGTTHKMVPAQTGRPEFQPNGKRTDSSVAGWPMLTEKHNSSDIRHQSTFWKTNAGTLKPWRPFACNRGRPRWYSGVMHGPSPFLLFNLATTSSSSTTLSCLLTARWRVSCLPFRPHMASLW
jgi:hypothetical protein